MTTQDQAPKKMIWTVVLSLLVLLVGYNLLSGLVAKKIGIPGIFEVEFDKNPSGTVSEKDLNDLSSSELAKRQAELEKKLRDLEEKANIEKGSQPQRNDRPQTQYMNVAGTWRSSVGPYYNVLQNGNIIIMEEISPGFGQTAVGQGVINQRNIEINLATAAFTNVQGHFTVSDDGRQMNGSFVEPNSGMSVPITIFR